MARRSPFLLAALLLAATSFLFSVKLAQSACDLRGYGPPYPLKDISDEFYWGVASFAVAEKNKERTPGQHHQLRLVSIDKGFYYPMSDYVSFYRLFITTSNHFGKAKYEIFVIDDHPVYDTFTLKCFDKI